MAKWKVGKVMSVNLPGGDAPYGFYIITEGGKAIVNLVYPTQDTAESAAKQIGLALEGVVSVDPFSPRPPSRRSLGQALF